MYDIEDFVVEGLYGNGNTNVCNIMLCGVGGAGCNTITRLMYSDLTSAEFVAVNTDSQILLSIKDKALNKKPNMKVKLLQIGKQSTKGQGAGAVPEMGKKAALESEDEIRKMLTNVQLLFLTAGMGGGTGTGASPVIAKIAKDMGILVVAIVFKPFAFEGDVRNSNAMQGITELRKYADSLVIIPNDKLDNEHILEGYEKGDDVIRKALKGIGELIAKPSVINLDFADVCKIIRNKGLAHIGIGRGEGESAAIQAVSAAVKNNLTDTNIIRAKSMIICYSSGKDFNKKEIENATNLVHELMIKEAEIIFGLDFDPSLGDQVNVIIIATGFELQPESPQQKLAQPDEKQLQPTPQAEPVVENREGRIGVDSEFVPEFMQRLRK